MGPSLRASPGAAGKGEEAVNDAPAGGTPPAPPGSPPPAGEEAPA